MISSSAIICQTGSFMYGGLKRDYIVHIPTGYNPSDSIPLIVALHNAYGSASDFANATGLNKVADDKKFIVVYPNGTGTPSSWNGGGCCFSAVTNNVDDVGFISVLIDTIKSKYSIDTLKVYTAGFSNGAILAYRLGAELNNKIYGVASACGPMMIDTILAKRRVPVIHFHALDDGSVPFSGGQASGYTFPSVNSTIEKWRTKDTCSEIPDTIVNEQGIKGLKWNSKDNKSNIVLYTSATGGHSWTMNSKFPVSDMIWEFFTTGTAHAKYTPVGIKDLSIDRNLKLKIHPNPTTENINIEFYLDFPDKVKVELLNLNGQVINSSINQNFVSGINRISYKIRNVNIPDGIYLIRLTSSKYSIVNRIYLKS